VQEVDDPELSSEQAAAGAQKLEEIAMDSTPAQADAQRLTAALLRLHSQRLSLAGRQRHLAERFTAAHPGVPVAAVPALAEDVHDLDGLRTVGDLMARDI
jgi:hypothetical protein